MLSSVLSSERVIGVNIAIMRTFVRLRYVLATHKELAAKLEAVETHCNRQFKVIFDVLRQLMQPAGPRKSPIGFVTRSHRK